MGEGTRRREKTEPCPLLHRFLFSPRFNFLAAVSVVYLTNHKIKKHTKKNKQKNASYVGYPG